MVHHSIHRRTLSPSIFVDVIPSSVALKQRISNDVASPSAAVARKKAMKGLVRFSEDVSIISPSREHILTPEVAEEAFHSVDDFERMLRESELVVQKHAICRYKDLPWDDNADSIRGVESELQLDLRLRSIRRHVHAVLREQYRLASEGRCPYDAIALHDVSSRMSLAHRSHAVALAKLDASVSGHRERVPLLKMVRSWF